MIKFLISIQAIVCLCSFASFSFAQPATVPIGARAVGMGGISTVHADVWSVVNNPGSLGLLDTVNIGLLHEQRFGMPELGVSSIVSSFPLLGNGVGVFLSNTGFQNYGENKFGIAIGRKLGAFVSAGIRINGYILRFPAEYSNLFAVTGDVGIWANPLQRVTIGVYISNVTFSKWNDREHSILPVLFSAGAGYAVASNILLAAELSKDVYEATRFKTGVEFSLFKVLQLRMGIITLPFQLHFGVGYCYKNFQFDAALTRHPVLGYSSQAAIGIKFS